MDDKISRIQTIQSVNKIRSEMGFVNIEDVKKAIRSVPAMGVESQMKSDIINEVHYGVNTWTHKKMDELRKSECLCLRCVEKETGFCDNAHKLFEVCQNGGMAVAVTRCAAFKHDQSRIS